jgi:hypothetical protein
MYIFSLRDHVREVVPARGEKMYISTESGTETASLAEQERPGAGAAQRRPGAGHHN